MKPSFAGACLALIVSLAAVAAAAVAAATNEGRTSGKGSQLVAMESGQSSAKVQVTGADLAPAAGHHYSKSHGKYYMYAEVPKKNAYKMGFKRGNGKHEIMRKESAHKSHVHSYFKWHDKKGKGSHKFEFKHYDKKKKHHY